MLEEIRYALLTEAKLSPQLLSDLAGLENYVAESYNSRSFIELLQNADDAAASSFIVKKSGDYLIIANNGKLFSSSDLQAICRSAASNKERGRSIGYRGIGFKSVVGLASEVHIISGDLQTTFSKGLTLSDVPNASKVPLIRIPHPISPIVKSETESEISQLKELGYSTFFIFTGLIVDSIDQEFLAFDPSCLLFLKNIISLHLNGARIEQLNISRKRLDDIFFITTLKTTKNESNWIISSKDEISVAFHQNVQTAKIEPLKEADAVIHAFLPTHEPTGLGIKINGDISTDPSRTRIVFDSRTENMLATIAQQISMILLRILNNEILPDAEGMLACLLPTEDPRLHKHQRKSFKTELMSAIKKECGKIVEARSLKPAWLNSADYEAVNKIAKLPSVSRSVSELEGASNFIRYLGAKESTITQLLDSLPASEITKLGCSEITSELIKLCDTKQLDSAKVSQDLPIFYSKSGRVSIKEAHGNNLKLDNDYLDLVAERSGGTSGLTRMIKNIAGADIAAKMLPTELTIKADPSIAPSTIGLLESLENIQPPDITNKKSLSLKKWRGAEEQIRDIFEAEGYKATDVSRQNIGYDIECENSLGEKYFIEVKLIETPSQPFTMTSNEEAVARQKGVSYIVAVIKQSNDNIEVSLIRDPVNTLTLTRQCRQWVWECNNYPYKPTLYKVQ